MGWGSVTSLPGLSAMIVKLQQSVEFFLMDWPNYRFNLVAHLAFFSELQSLRHTYLFLHYLSFQPSFAVALYFALSLDLFFLGRVLNYFVDWFIYGWICDSAAGHFFGSVSSLIKGQDCACWYWFSSLTFFAPAADPSVANNLFGILKRSTWTHN